MNSDMTLASGNLRIVRLGIDGRAALSERLVAAIAGACDDLEDGRLPAVLRLHIRGGKDAGEAWPGDVNVSVLHHWEQVLHRLERLQGVTVAVASGACGGAALELLLAADHRVAVPAFVTVEVVPNVPPPARSAVPFVVVAPTKSTRTNTLVTDATPAVLLVCPFVTPTWAWVSEFVPVTVHAIPVVGSV